MGRKSRACVPCHKRKVRCDAGQIGSPCTRCVKNDCADLCLPMGPPDRDKRKNSQGRREGSIASSRRASHPGPPGRWQSPGTSTLAPSARPVANEFVLDDDSLPRLQPSVTSMSSQIDGTTLTEDNSPVTPNDVADYHEGTNPLSILHEALEGVNRSAIIEQALQSGGPISDSKSGLDDVDVDYLRRKGAFDMPPRRICDQLLILFFEQVYATAPVFNRITFVRQYCQHTHSYFLLHAILASVVRYAPLELLNEAGFTDIQSAQQTFFMRAKLLHDIGVEKDQVRLLQGSLFLSVSHISCSMEQDYRYWISNAARIVVKMGLHKNNFGEHMDANSRKLFRRIWWTIYCWDQLLALHGLDSVRRFHYADIDIPALTEDDWFEEEIPSDVADLLAPIPTVQKMFQIFSCKLLLISSKFWHSFASMTLESAIDELENSMRMWRQSLSPDMRMNEARYCSKANLWVPYLNARGYVCECVLYRTLRQHFRSIEPTLSQRLHKGLCNALFELDTIICRLSMTNLAKDCPWFMYNCACTALALHIEMALSPTITSHEKFLITMRVQSELEIIRELSKQSASNRRTQRIFEAIIRYTGLSLRSVDKSTSAQSPANAPMPLDGGSDQLSTQPIENEADYIITRMGLDAGDHAAFNFSFPFDFQFGPGNYNLGDLMSDQWASMELDFQSTF